jgi:hypothetical protein
MAMMLPPFGSIAASSPENTTVSRDRAVKSVPSA